MPAEGGNSGVGNGNRTRNRRSHSPVLCQLSYSHRHGDYSNCSSRMSEAAPLDLPGADWAVTPRPSGDTRWCEPDEQERSRTSRRWQRRNHRQFQRETGQRGNAGLAAWTAVREWRILRSRVLGLGENLIGLQFLYPHGPRTIVGSAYPRPTPTYSNPMARSRVESSRFFVSTMMGFFNRCLMRSKSRARNSGQPVPTTNASMPSAAA